MAQDNEAGFHLYSPDVETDGEIDASFEYNGFGCAGDNQSPTLRWENAPAGTRSFAVSVHDPDAPTGSGWWHWRVVNLPADTTELAGNAGAVDGDNLPDGAVQLRNDYGDKGWGGMCPPAGDSPHRYTFTVHALNTEQLELPEDASPALAGFMIHQHEISRAGFIATYAREED
ncbi:YbhB/YbcL family Raf kinase inhibitor-like protein [Aliidiomarina sedimenti]|uniref:YbhB/YbcL family Raf kinase inhibitor-like protein n=2 Tax=Aliidiomarina sedimenti TaxID=1933879 RepID=A0ABY0C3C5_9GAMM|nr:YbhB/YbcL family Raf kinase inhibitor-like protein [Aliidiomarina sedimenti]